MSKELFPVLLISRIIQSLHAKQLHQETDGLSYDSSVLDVFMKFAVLFNEFLEKFDIL